MLHIIATISPSRTFLEKAFLLSEEYQRKNPRTIRMSRHLYDLERLMDTEYAESALGDFELYKRIVEHRRKFYHVGGVNYDLDFPATVMFCPVGEMHEKIGEDYKKMCSSFIYCLTLKKVDSQKSQICTNYTQRNRSCTSMR